MHVRLLEGRLENLSACALQAESPSRCRCTGLRLAADGNVLPVNTQHWLHRNKHGWAWAFVRAVCAENQRINSLLLVRNMQSSSAWLSRRWRADTLAVWGSGGRAFLPDSYSACAKACVRRTDSCAAVRYYHYEISVLGLPLQCFATAHRTMRATCIASSTRKQVRPTAVCRHPYGYASRETERE